MKILWLASWYPDAFEPYNGDFIQRHAQAVANLVAIDVLHIPQKSSTIISHAYKKITTLTPTSNECVAYFNYTPFGIQWLDKLRFNSTYLQFGKTILQQYVEQFGKPDIIHVHAPMKMGMLALYAKQKWGIPFIISEQASHYELAAPDNFFTRSKFYKIQTTKIFKQAAMVTNVSATIGKTIQQIFQLQKIHTIHNCVDTSLFYYKPTIKKELFTFIHVSALGKQKNIAGLLDAFTTLNIKYSKWQLLLVGPVNNELEELINTTSIKEKIILTKSATYKQVAYYMQQAHAFVLFSNHENFPCVVVEALCCGLPVISSRVGGVAEAINAENGIIVEPNNTAQLAYALENIIKHHNEYNSHNIALKAAQQYNYTFIAEQFITLYKAILQQR